MLVISYCKNNCSIFPIDFANITENAIVSKTVFLLTIAFVFACFCLWKILTSVKYAVTMQKHRFWGPKAMFLQRKSAAFGHQKRRFQFVISMLLQFNKKLFEIPYRSFPDFITFLRYAMAQKSDEVRCNYLFQHIINPLCDILA